MLNTATMKSRFNSELTRRMPQGTSTATLNFWNTVLVNGLRKLEAFEAMEKSIRANTSLSDEGKQQQLAKLSHDSLTEWEWLGQLVKDKKAARAQFKTMLFTVEPTVKDELLRYLRAREIRDRMAGLNQNGRNAAYITASERGESETLLALQDAPGGSWVAPDIQQRVDVERAEHTQPDVFANYTQNEILIERLDGLADHLAQWLKSYGASPEKVNKTLGVS